jgi:glutamate-1-semialdehyde 2,1-aminomutase
MLTVFFCEGPVRNFAGAKASDMGAYAAFFQRLLEHGVYVPPSPFEAMFVATVHGEDEIDQTVEAARGLNSPTAA